MFEDATSLAALKAAETEPPLDIVMKIEDTESLRKKMQAAIGRKPTKAAENPQRVAESRLKQLEAV